MNHTLALAAPTAAASPRPGRWRRVIAWLLIAVVVLAAVSVVGWLDAQVAVPVDVTIDGIPVVSSLDVAGWPMLAAVGALVAGVALLIGIAATVAVAVALVPLLAIAIGLPLLLAGAVLLALLSPLILLAWLLWRVARPATIGR